MKKVRNINTFITLVSSKASKLDDDSELLEYVISEHIQNRWKQEYDLKGMGEDLKWKDIQTLLLTYEEHFSSNSDKNSERSLRDNRNSKGKNHNGNLMTGWDKDKQGTGKLKKSYKIHNNEKMSETVTLTTPTQIISRALPW